MTVLDTARPNPARMYDYLLGGKDNYAADRDEAVRLIADFPELRGLAQSNRAFIAKAADWAAREGIGQFLDLGCGLPARPSVHETARAVIGDARVAYVDIDPVVHAHVAALQASGRGLAAVRADLKDPGAVLAHPEVEQVIDPAEPVCVILGAVLQYIPPDRAGGIIAGYAEALAPGSAVVISAAWYEDPAVPERMAGLYDGQCHAHTARDITRYLDGAGLRLVRGYVANACWWPGPVPDVRKPAVILGEIAVKD
jgi:O-methyltransferase involved in polyketide biosynthesis